MDYFAIGEDKSLKNINDVESWEKLWENPNPNSTNFAAQIIILSKFLSLGDEIAITTRLGAIFMGKVTKTSGNVLHLSDIWHGGPAIQTGYLYIHTRIVGFGSESNSMDFSNCYQNTLVKNGDNWPQTPIRDYVESNNALVPIAVYKRLSNQFN